MKNIFRVNMRTILPQCVIGIKRVYKTVWYVTRPSSDSPGANVRPDLVHQFFTKDAEWTIDLG